MSAKKMALTDTEKFKMIELFENSPCIWDASNSHYHDRSFAANAYISIAQQMDNGMTDEDVRKQFKSLRTQFAVQLRRPRSSVEWKYFSSLQYLRPYVTVRTPKIAQDNMKVSKRMRSNHGSAFRAQNHREMDNGDHNDSQTSDMSLVMTVEGEVDHKQWDDMESGGDLQTLMKRVGSQKELRPHQFQIGSMPQPARHGVKRSLSESSSPVHQQPEVHIPYIVNSPAVSVPSPLAHCRPQQHPESTFSDTEAVSSPVYSGKHKDTKKRKTDPFKACVAALNELASAKKKKSHKDASENDLFFKMITAKVGKFPANLQEKVRNQIYQLVVQEQEKLYINE